ncbi:UDP-N-acetylmuramoyl-tripeptide--D-alanyl-D-alanine ligase [Zeaxanthinibacter sp. PT1]|uniref:UDP-N-acetylmuramoyl-tripeptide--D-alanyl-D- alanine ligase n=1 Tax=Zeaxanthinibacter TaxID=561554 RepID=UPI00234BE79A|nr:UDP-N-acetylmuramoyl-tripeptide--D-alanyl-D-alanine ligase [Zeaxanthinibacter sp. PT1]MDC6352683.1 UDP-N-acetylmuramoyl-tripeptide--D-alanyl-D-alanine ligase [Zeaxanthinibacter sp. PT1]
MTTEHLYEHFLKSSGACTDTRNISENCLFFALKGDNFNGNKFAGEAIEHGATLAVIDEAEYHQEGNTILVDNVLESLQQLGRFHRMHSKARVIGLTGSNGKTTTKELMHSVLSQSYRVIATRGNLNNHIGVPLTLLRIKKDTEIAIIEMGANHQKEIEFLCTLAEPDFGYITNFGKAHLEGFGGVAGVIAGKSELYNHLKNKNAPIFMNADDQVQREKLQSYTKKIGFSTSDKNYYQIKFLEASPFVSLEAEGTVIKTQLVGKYNFNNCCAALLIGKYFNVPMVLIQDALSEYIPENNRSQLVEQAGYHILLDAYNANPTSMKAALENFDQLRSDTKCAILGDMFELGKDAEQEHQEIAELAAKSNFSEVLLVGKNFSRCRTSLKQFEGFEKLSEYLEKHKLPKGDILIKGSRGMALERVLPLLN